MPPPPLVWQTIWMNPPHIWNKWEMSLPDRKQCTFHVAYKTVLYIFFHLLHSCDCNRTVPERNSDCDESPVIFDACWNWRKLKVQVISASEFVGIRWRKVYVFCVHRSFWNNCIYSLFKERLFKPSHVYEVLPSTTRRDLHFSWTFLFAIIIPFFMRLRSKMQKLIA